MKATIASFKMLLRHISRDGMLVVICMVPVFVGVLFRYVIPTHIEPLLPFDITAYYLLFDLMIAVMIPYLFCFASSLAMLEEIDENLASYLSVTPVAKDGYLISRLLFPAAISEVITILFLSLCSLTKLSFLMIISLSFSMSLLAMITSMLVISVAKNKIEGMALSKASGILIVGLFIPFFMTDSIQYIFGFLPSLWIAKLAMTSNYLYLLPIIITSLLWIIMMRKVYLRKLL